MSQGMFAQFHATQLREPTESATPAPVDRDVADTSSSRKRSHHVAGIEEEEVEVESASSNLRNSLPHKRPRVARVSAASSRSSDDGVEVEQQAGLGADAHQDEDESVEDSRTLGEGDDELEVDELRATQIVEKQMREYRENIESQEGVIEEVFCRNFMCHTKLRIKLGPLINFIIGHNGSGKSAVLTALTVCLGESARKTNRGGNLKGMIKNGEEHASLAVKIRNRGEGAYKPELYGRSITVERNFSRSGNNVYKLKNSEDKTVSTKKADLDDLLDYFGLQIDNPINVLTQDLARQFLANSSPSDKYKFFIRGTRLEELDRDYNVMEENLDKIQAKLVSRKEDIPDLKLRYDQAEARRKRLEKAETIGRRLNEAKNQHAWAQVCEQEDLLEQYNTDVERADQQVHGLEEAAETVSGAYDGHNQSYETTERLVTSLREQLVPCEEQRATIKETFNATSADLKNSLAEERDVKEHMKKEQERTKMLAKQVAEERSRIAEAEGEEHARRLQKLEELEAGVNAARQESAGHAEKVEDLRHQQTQTFGALETARATREQKQGEFSEAKRSLLEMGRSQGHPFAGYNQNMEKLVRAVDQETRWRHKPVGPMGRHVRLLKPKWSHQIEKTFGAALNAFVVTTNDDKRLLSDLMKNRSIDTILSVLTIDNPLVRNQLIINTAIEQVLLIHERRVAERLLNGNGQLRNVKAAISIGNQPTSGVRQDYSRGGQGKSSFIDAWGGAPRMQTDLEEQMAHQREVVDDYTRAVDHADRAVKEKQAANFRAGQDVKKWEREAQRLKTGVQQAEDRVEEQSNDIEAHRPKDGRLQELERQLQDSKDEYQSLGPSYQDAIVAKDDLSQKSKDAKHALDDADAEYNAGKARVTHAEERLVRLSVDRRTALLAKNEALNSIDHAKQAHTETQERRDNQANNVTVFIGHANEICRRVPLDPGTTTRQLDERIERLGVEMQQQERAAGGTAEELVLRWQQAKTEYDDAVAQLKSAELRKDKLTRTLSYRRFRWKEFQRFISYRARFTFKYLLSERNFRGSVEMSHVDKTLDIAIEPDISAQEAEGREARSLSGGEKSFSTICLLLSIWEAMGSPIRCLDEFDVFMDSVNRAESIKLLMQAARRAVGRQFILISPQAMGRVELGDDVKIHKMSDPERGQGVLPFTQA
ncbi:Structural maintenance of chromosomes protein 6 [Teratosphaeriaceae sp. CCFEE 6253]|nr:Structural maintenance of chromosomes protein 6 [Teratosphaeriaceae sp. CCFEE 6253]